MKEGQTSIQSLHEVYREYFDIGAAVTPRTIVSHRDLLSQHFNSVTAENEMKFERIQPSEGKFAFADADSIMDFATLNGMKVRGHTLVWHNQTPRWVFVNKDGSPADRDTVLARMKEHIDTVVNRYKGKIYCWDVVNEVIDEESDAPLRPSPWLDTIGEDFIAKAFEFAHAADEDALLFYNDYNESDPAKCEKIVRLVKSLQEKGVPIHGVGLQAHWNVAQPDTDHIRRAIEQYATLGLRIHVTEMDVSVFAWEDHSKIAQPTADMLELQRGRYEQFFTILRSYKDVIDNVTFWGVADDVTWLDDFPVRGRKNWPFVFDVDHQPKASFWSLTDF